MSDRPSKRELQRTAEEVGRLQQVFRKIGRWDTWICTVDLGGWLDGDIKDFPSHIQDAIYAAVEKQCVPKPGERVEVVLAKCYRDVPDEPIYMRIVVQAFPILVH